jgi:hypothetical protein
MAIIKRASLIVLVLFFSSILVYSGPKNKTFNNVRVLRSLAANSIIVFGNTIINGNLNVIGTVSSQDSLKTEGAVAQNAAVRFAESSGKIIKSSPVNIDDAGNIEINGITKNGNTIIWPITVGASGTFLASDGLGNLVYSIPVGVTGATGAMGPTGAQGVTGAIGATGAMGNAAPAAYASICGSGYNNIGFGIGPATGISFGGDQYSRTINLGIGYYAVFVALKNAGNNTVYINIDPTQGGGTFKKNGADWNSIYSLSCSGYNTVADNFMVEVVSSGMLVVSGYVESGPDLVTGMVFIQQYS